MSIELSDDVHKLLDLKSISNKQDENKKNQKKEFNKILCICVTVVIVCFSIIGYLIYNENEIDRKIDKCVKEHDNIKSSTSNVIQRYSEIEMREICSNIYR